MLTVARKRWVQERRIPRAFWWITGSLGLSLEIVIPVSITIELSAVTPLLIAFAGATGVGLGFGENVLAAEYPSLPMTVTTASGSHVIRGTMLAGLVIGVPLTILPTVAIGIAGRVGSAVGAVFDDRSDAPIGEIDERVGVVDALTGVIVMEIVFDVGRQVSVAWFAPTSSCILAAGNLAGFRRIKSESVLSSKGCEIMSSIY